MSYIERWYKDTKSKMRRGYLFGGSYVEYYCNDRIEEEYYKMVAADQAGIKWIKEKVTPTQLKNAWELEKEWILNMFMRATEKEQEMIEEIIIEVEDIIYW